MYAKVIIFSKFTLVDTEFTGVRIPGSQVSGPMLSMDKNFEPSLNIFAFYINNSIISRAAHWVPTSRVIYQVEIGRAHV